MRALWLAAVLAAPAGAAGTTHSAASAGARAVFYRPTDAEHAQWSPGAQLRLPLSPEYALEGSVDWTRYQTMGETVTTTPVQVTLLGFFSPESEGSGYLLLGGGWYLGHTGPHRRFGLHAGGGLQILRDERWSLDASYRFLWTQVFSWARAPYYLGHDHKERGHLITIGLNRRF